MTRTKHDEMKARKKKAWELYRLDAAIARHYRKLGKLELADRFVKASIDWKQQYININEVQRYIKAIGRVGEIY